MHIQILDRNGSELVAYEAACVPRIKENIYYRGSIYRVARVIYSIEKDRLFRPNGELYKVSVVIK